MPVTAFLVEDSPIIRAELIPALRELGDVDLLGYAEGEREAREWLAANADSCDLIVIDLFLKEGSGFGVLQAVMDLSRSTRRVVLSNYATAEMRRQALALGADAIFDKSTELGELFAYCVALDPTGGKA